MMTLLELLALHESTTKKCREVMKAKNNDYTQGSTSGVFKNFEDTDGLPITREQGLMLRLGDKRQRILTFLSKGALLVEGEGVDDAIDDSINYLILLKGMLKENASRGIQTVSLDGETATFPLTR